jgi:hypothetical protein
MNYEFKNREQLQKKNLLLPFNVYITKSELLKIPKKLFYSNALNFLSSALT